MNWRLIFSGFQSPGWAIYAVVGVSLAIGLSVWLMRLERRLVSGSVGGVLISLRVLVLLTLLVTLLQPVLTKQFDIVQRGRVVVAIDGSLSMETQDRHASMAEKLRWAQALGMIGNAETASLIDQWVLEAEAGETPNWLGAGSRPGNSAEQSTSDARGRQVNDALQELSEMPRIEFVRRLLQSQPKRLLEQFGEVMPVDIRVFASEQQPTTTEGLASQLSSARSNLLPGNTDTLELLQSMTSEEDAGQLRAVVLLSDGRQTVPGDVAGVGQRLASLGVPVYSVPIGSRFPPRDLSIAAVDAPEAIFLNDKAQILAVLGTSGFEGEPLRVRLERDGVVVDQQTVTPTSDTATLTFSMSSDKAGRFDYKLATDIKPGELRDDNNSRDISVKVVDNKARVMLVEGDARWEFRYFKNLLDRDKQVVPQTVLFHQPFLDLLNEPPISSKLPDLEAFKSQLAATDMLLLGDIRPSDVEPGVWELIEQAVARDGLTLVIVPGRNSMPHEFNSPVLSSLLPVKEFRQRLAEQFQASAPDVEQSTFHLTLTPDAQSLPMFQLSENPEVRDTSLSALPGHPWIYGGVPKPGASVWASASITGVQMQPEPTLIHHDYGFGQVVWMGIDSTWRWRRRAGDEWHYKFWGQLIRWAARNKASAGNSDVRLSLSEAIVSETESAEVVVRWDSKLLPQLEGATVEVVATPVDPASKFPSSGVDANRAGADGKKNATTGDSEPESRFSTRLQSSSESAERFSGRLPQLPAGTWQITLQVTGGSLQSKEPVTTELLVKRQVSAELANVSCNRDLLRQLSQLSGGEMVEPFDAQRLVSLIQPKDQPEQKSQERTLWDHWLVMAIFFTLLMSEWVIRKLNGLP